jgi:hypothetical protein
MKPARTFSDQQLARAREVCSTEARIAALYAVPLGEEGDYHLAALYAGNIPWPQRLDLEVAMARALGMDSTEIIDMRRMSLVFRYNVVRYGTAVYVGEPDRLAIFIEQTVARYSAFYPLLEALYWRVETGPLTAELLETEP